MWSAFRGFLISFFAVSLAGAQTAPLLSLREDCESGGGAACRELGRYYLSATLLPGDPIRAVRLFERACGGGELGACDDLGVQHALGFGTEEDFEEARRVFEDACDKGYSVSCRRLAMLFSGGVGVVKDEARAASLFDRACDGGDAVACEDLALASLEGRGIEANREKAAALLEQACAAKLASACVRRWLLDHPPAPSGRLLEYGRTLDAAVIRLGDDRWRTRATMAEGIGELGRDAKSALPELLFLLGDPQGYVRNEAVRAISRIGPPDDGAAAGAVLRVLTEVDGDHHLRGQLAEALGGYGAEALPRLSTLLGDEFPEVRASAARALGRLGAPAASSDLLVALEDPAESVRWEAAIALASTASGGGQPVNSLLRNASRADDAAPDVRVRAAAALASRGKPKLATAALVGLWKDSEDAYLGRENRLVVLEALERLGPLARSAKPLLRKTLSDRDPDLRDRAMSALRAVAPSEADAWLREVHDKERDYYRKGVERRSALSPSSAGARVAAIRALDTNGEPGKTVPFLVAFLDDAREFRIPTDELPIFTSPAGEVAAALASVGAPAVEAMVAALESASESERGYAVRVLGGIGGERAVQALAAQLDAGPLRFESARALVALKDPRGVPALLSALEGPDGFAQWQAAAALANFPDPRATDALIQAVLQSPYYEARKSAASALGAIGDPKAIPALLTMIENDHELLRWEAGDAVSGMGNAAFRAAAEALASEDVGRRLAGVQVFENLGRRGDPRVVEALSEHLGGESSKDVKVAAVHAIRSGGSTEAIEALLMALEDPETRLAAARELYDAEDPKAVGPLMRALGSAGEDEVEAILTALRRITGRPGSTKDEWLSWWEEGEEQWQRARAFSSRRVRIGGIVVDEAGEPVPDVQVLASRAGNEPLRGLADANSASSCLEDGFGALYFVEDGDELLNPYAATDSTGSFELGDWRRLFLVGERYELFVSSGSGCRRLWRGAEPAGFTIGVDDERIDLGRVTLLAAPS